MPFIPLSQRENPDPAFEGPYEGLPRWLFQSAKAWLLPLIEDGRGYPDETFLRELESSLRVEKPLHWSDVYAARASMVTRMWEREEFALDVLDFRLAGCEPGSPAARSLDAILIQGGSVFEVGSRDTGGCQLVRRSVGPVRDAIDGVRSESQRAHTHLIQAWNRLMGRNPDPSSAYREAIRAVEVVAAPVVTPDDPSPTLGKIISALRDKPAKWTLDLAEARPEQVTEMAAMIWQSQFDRHGTHDESVPLNVSQEQADAAVHIALALVRLFAGGHMKRN
jgi:hypothetical protein